MKTNIHIVIIAFFIFCSACSLKFKQVVVYKNQNSTGSIVSFELWKENAPLKGLNSTQFAIIENNKEYPLKPFPLKENKFCSLPNTYFFAYKSVMQDSKLQLKVKWRAYSGLSSVFYPTIDNVYSPGCSLTFKNIQLYSTMSGSKQITIAFQVWDDNTVDNLKKKNFRIFENNKERTTELTIPKNTTYCPKTDTYFFNYVSVGIGNNLQLHVTDNNGRRGKSSLVKNEPMAIDYLPGCTSKIDVSPIDLPRFNEKMERYKLDLQVKITTPPKQPLNRDHVYIWEQDKLKKVDAVQQIDSYNYKLSYYPINYKTSGVIQVIVHQDKFIAKSTFSKYPALEKTNLSEEYWHLISTEKNGRKILDMTKQTWKDYSIKKQRQIAAMYQKAYAQSQKLKVIEEYDTDRGKIPMVLIPPGRFAPTKGCWQHFRIAKYEIARKDNSKPQTNISFSKVNQLCQTWSIQLLPKGLSMQLPSQVQWEYACRAGAVGKYSFEIDKKIDYVWFDKFVGSDVKKRKANAFGLHNMHGNVSEWCLEKKHCGGSYRDQIENCTSDYAPEFRGEEDAIGFRPIVQKK
ncbi:formylglycine-generating enzyme family protein [Candidatus Uabimicrobium sp. HlEnr_7]|uniref:formylglycine-generating enzyme family protein n=1 Tax=Candidatus Uabimicrobium helgolandensis TaxID=3095367 RepID=UPI003555EF8E